MSTSEEKPKLLEDRRKRYASIKKMSTIIKRSLIDLEFQDLTYNVTMKGLKNSGS